MRLEPLSNPPTCFCPIRSRRSRIPSTTLFPNRLEHQRHAPIWIRIVRTGTTVPQRPRAPSRGRIPWPCRPAKGIGRRWREPRKSGTTSTPATRPTTTAPTARTSITPRTGTGLKRTGPARDPDRRTITHVSPWGTEATEKEQTRSYPSRRPGARPSTKTLEPRTPAVRGSNIQRRSINQRTGHGETQIGNQASERDDTPEPHGGPRPLPRRVNTRRHAARRHRNERDRRTIPLPRRRAGIPQPRAGIRLRESTRGLRRKGNGLGKAEAK
jgi:hypothetical protein